MSRRVLLVWARALLFALLLAGSAFAVRQFRKSRQALDLPTAAARQGDFRVLIRCRGELTASHSVQLAAPLDVPDLQIVSMATAGGPVRAGQIVIQFDPSRAQQDLKEKQAALRQAEASLAQAVAQARNTAEQDKLDLAKARYDAERAKLEASKQAIVSALDGQKSVIDLGLAEEKVKVQEATIALHQASDDAKIASQQRLRDEAKAQVDLTQSQLALMQLKSPIDGVINYSQNYTQGWMNSQPFKVGDHAVPGSILAEIPDLSTLQMESKVDEVDRGRIALGQTVLVHVDAFPEKVITAKMASVAPLIEQGFEWPPTRNFKSYARLETRDPGLRPGMNAGADIVEQTLPGAISIPAKALFTIHGKPAVYVKKDGRYLPVEVRIKARNPDEVAIEGIPAGSLVAMAEPPQESR